MSNNKTIIAGFVVILLLAVLFAGSVLHMTKLLFVGPAPVIVQGTPSVVQIQRLSELATLRLTVRAVIKADQEGRWGTTLGETRMIYDARGEVTLGVDLQQIELTNIDETLKTAVIRLPSPRVLQYRIILDKSDFLVKDLSWLRTSKTNAALERGVLIAAEAAIKQEGEQPELTRVSKDQAERILAAFYSPLGWSLKFEWGK